MTTLLATVNLTNGNSKKCDDFTKIKGIGLAKQQWLRESLSVFTFQDLASLSVEAIETSLKVEWQSVSRREIKRWINQAQELAVEELSLQPFVDFSDVEAKASEEHPIQSVETTLDTELKLIDGGNLGEKILCKNTTSDQQPPLPQITEAEWESFASFKVEFQSRQTERQVKEQQVIVRFLETDQVQSWSSLENDQLQQWMLKQLQVNVSNQMQQGSETGNSVAVPLVAIEIDEIRAFQPPYTNSPLIAGEGNRLFKGMINSDHPFTLEVTFSLTGLNVANMTKMPIAYWAQFYARNRVTEVTHHLGDTEPCPLREGELSYTVMLPEFTLETGVYRLQAIVNLQGIPATPASFKVPLLQVI